MSRVCVVISISAYEFMMLYAGFKRFLCVRFCLL